MLKSPLKCIVALCIGLCASSAFAALGSAPLAGSNPRVMAQVMNSASVKATKASQASAAAPSSNGAYSVNVVTLTSGTVVREFIAKSSNTVFAVTWHGPRLPNFADILGGYSERYLKPSASDAVRVGGVSQRSLNASDLVVQSQGHFGDFSGYAYLPSEVPAGVSLSELQ